MTNQELINGYADSADSAIQYLRDSSTLDCSRAYAGHDLVHNRVWRVGGLVERGALPDGSEWTVECEAVVYLPGADGVGVNGSFEYWEK